VSDVKLMIKWTHNHNKFENQPKKVEYQVRNLNLEVTLYLRIKAIEKRT
jgi:hypothetical protein